MPQPWRLLPFLIADGTRQMAIDKAIFTTVESGQSLPTLRFYQWEPIAISLGYHQRAYPDHWQGLQFDNKPIDLVRRPTGGRAVLHQGDLTYAVIASGMSLGISASRTESYRQICEFLIQGWRSLGHELSYGSAGRGYIQNPNCFGTATGADLVLPDGRKLIGSAQKRSVDTVLQHGSMRLQPNAELFEMVFQGSEKFEPSASLSMPSVEKIIAALILAAETCFDMELTIGTLSNIEEEKVMRALQFPI
jgi:lipoate---protein ligase